MSTSPAAFSVEGIMACQKNRFPMLFIDVVDECVPGSFAKGYKLFSYNEWYFQSSGPDEPTVWSAIKVEAMSQMFLMTFLTEQECIGAVTMSNKFDNVEFVREVIPGDRLDLEANLHSFRRGVARGHVKGFVEGNLACSMDCTVIVPQAFGDVSRPSVPHSGQIASVCKVVEPSMKASGFGLTKIRQYLSMDYPWLLLDRVEECEPGQFVRALKNFTFNEHYFPTHFPGDPNVPGFIQMECCVQAFLLSVRSKDAYSQKGFIVSALRDVRLRRKIVPGDALRLNARLESFADGVAHGTVESFVNNEPAISLGLSVTILGADL